MRILHNGGLLKHTAAARKARFGYLFILPFVLGLAVIFIPNIVQTFLYSISEIDPSEGFALNPKGFVFYRDALTVDPKFTRMLLTDLAGLLADVPVILIYSLFIATLLIKNSQAEVWRASFSSILSLWPPVL